MTIKIEGIKEIEKILDKKFSKRQLRKITDASLTVAGNKVVQLLKKNMSVFEDTGATVRDITLSEPKDINGVRTVQIHWDMGSKAKRYYIIHLNEFGHYDRGGNWVNPRGKGVIESSLKTGREVYFKEVKRQLERAL